MTDADAFATPDGPLSRTTVTCPVDECDETFTGETRSEARGLRYIHCRGEHWPDVLTATVVSRIKDHDKEVRADD